MKTHRLGASPLEVSAIGLGCMTMTGLYGACDDNEAIATIHRAAEVGVNLLDTSDAYGNGRNETFVGKAIADRRDSYIVITKFGNIRFPDGRQGVNSRPEYVIEACDASLKRLGIDTIDLYLQHRVDPDTPIAETVGAMARLVEQGKVRYLGLSEAGIETIRRAHAEHPMTALQTEYSLWSRDVEESILPTCRELGIGFLAYSPLGRGFLTGRIDSLDRLEDEGPAARSSPFRCGKPGAEPGALGTDSRVGRCQGLFARADRVGVVAREGKRHRADSRHQAS